MFFIRMMDMRCCNCENEIDVEKNDVPSKWYGTYIGVKIVKVICDKCIRTVQGMEEYEKKVK